MNNEKFVRSIGIPKKASSYLFYISNKSDADAILEYFQNALQTGVGDTLIIRPEDSEGTKDEVSIKQVREMLHFLNLTPEKGAKIAAVLGAELMNKASANAFLKILEEPPKDAVILLFAYSDTLLPTIKSRCRIYNLRSGVAETGEYDEELIEKFKGNFKEISDTIEVYIKGEKSSELLASLEIYVRQKLLAERTVELARFAKAIEKAKGEIRRNANQKLTIECLILNYREIIRK